MIKNVLCVAMLSLCMAITLFASSPALAGNDQSQPSNPPTYSPVGTLEEVLQRYSNCMKQSHNSLFKTLGGERTEHTELDDFHNYEFVNDGSNACYIGTSKTPMGIVYRNPGLNKFTVANVKALLGEPKSQRTAEDGLLQLSYDPVEGSPYLQAQVDFKFSEDKLVKMALVAP